MRRPTGAACRFPSCDGCGAVCVRAARSAASWAPPRSFATVLLAPSTAMRYGELFPSAILDWSPLLHVVRSGVGVILTSPSLLVEGVRSGSRRRNAATASVAGRRGSARNRGLQRPAGWSRHCAVGMWGMPGTCAGGRAKPGIAQRAFRPRPQRIIRRGLLVARGVPGIARPVSGNHAAHSRPLANLHVLAYVVHRKAFAAQHGLNNRLTSEGSLDRACLRSPLEIFTSSIYRDRTALS